MRQDMSTQTVQHSPEDGHFTMLQPNVQAWGLKKQHYDFQTVAGKQGLHWHVHTKPPVLVASAAL